MRFEARASARDDDVVLDALPATGQPMPARWDSVTDALPAPRRAHPGFWMALLWCIVFLLVTQTPGSVLAVAEILVGIGEFRRGEQAKAEQQADSLERPGHSQTPENELPAYEPKKPPAFRLSTKQVMEDLLQSDLVRDSLMHALAITEICVVLFSWLMIRLVVGADWKRKLALRRPGSAHTLLAIMGLPALSVLGVGFYAFATKVLHIPGMETLLKGVQGTGEIDIPWLQQIMDNIKQWPLPLAILIIGLGPGIGEELWCRGFLGRGLVGRYGVVVGIAMTSFFFGLIHLDPAQGTMAMLMGICLHFVYQTTRSLWLSILLHFMNNTLSVVQLRFPAFDALDNRPQDFVPLFAASALFVAAIGYALYQSRARLATAKAGAVHPWRPDFPGVEHPPEDSGTIVVHPHLSYLALGGVVCGFLLFCVSCCLAYQKLVAPAGS